MGKKNRTSAAAERKRRKKKNRAWPWVLLALVLVCLGVWDGQLLGLWTLVPTATPAPSATPAPTAAPTAAPTPAPTATPSLFRAEGGYLLCADGLFYPESPLTRGEAAEALRAAGRTVEDEGDPSAPLNEEELQEMCAAASRPETAAEAMDVIRGLGDETVTRAEAAVFFNRLFGLAPTEEERVYLPDAAPDYWAWGDIQTAARSGYDWQTETGRLPQGYFMRQGYLYLADGEGYLVKNTFEGSLRFGPTGRYTSGSPELDDYVAAMLRENTDDTMTREEKLRAAYLYVRDNFDYLRRHYYRIGDVGWATQEALTMYSTGKGNCYCYASAFWAAARQLGYQAKVVSGTYGKTERAPHGWVEIIHDDGVRLTYDVEIEMVMRSKNERGDAYAMTDGYRSFHGYVEMPYKDDLIPRYVNEGMLPA